MPSFDNIHTVTPLRLVNRLGTSRVGLGIARCSHVFKDKKNNPSMGFSSGQLLPVYADDHKVLVPLQGPGMKVLLPLLDQFPR